MDCSRVRELLSDYLEDALADRDRAAVAAHLDGCASCAAEAAGLSETIALLSALPRETAPPELLGRVMEGIERGAAGTSRRRKPAAFARVKIPVEAAAAVFLLLLVYGSQRGMPVRPVLPPGESGGPQSTATAAPNAAPALPASPPLAAAPPPPAAPLLAGASRSPRTSATGSPAAATAEKFSRAARGRAPSAPTAPGAEEVAAAATRADSGAAGFATVPAKPEAGEPAAGSRVEGPSATFARPAPAAPVAPPPPPGVTIVSAAVGAGAVSDRETMEPTILAAPPSRLFKAVPYGREVTLEVASAERGGIEERIVAAAQRLGGGAHPGIALRAERAQPLLPGAVRVHLPRDASGAFLDALRDLGTIPPEGLPGAADFPAGPDPDTVSYTVRIRVR